MRKSQLERLRQLATVARLELPEGPIVGNISRIPHRQVEYIAKLIDNAGVVDQIDDWYWEDHGGKKPGGAKRIVSTHAVLTLFLLISVEHSAQLVDDIAKLAATRLSKHSLKVLGLWDPARRKRGWYWPIYHSAQRVLTAIDPKPAKGRRRKFPTLLEIEEIKKEREKNDSSAKQPRLEWVVNRIIDATIREVPAEILDNWQGDTAIDATVVPVYSKRGAPWSQREAKAAERRGALEFDAGWYLRTGRHDITEDFKTAKKRVFGYDATVVTMTAHDPNELPLHPLFVLGIGLTIPSAEVAETGVKVYQDIVARDYKRGRATGDRAYGPGTDIDKYQLPMMELGYDLYSDYKDKQLGATGGHYRGAMNIEGGWYCPTMPENLINATIDYRAKTITLEEYRQLIQRRLQYKFREKEAPDEKGRVPMMCPARGPGATAECPLARALGGVKEQTRPDDDLVQIYDTPTDEKGELLPVCTNKSSVSFPREAGAKMHQTAHYGSQEWAETYRNDRSTIESKNAYLKDGAREGLGDPTKRRLRGYAAQYLLIGMLYAAANLRILETFRDELTEPESDEALEQYFEKKLADKLSRKADGERRRNRWDNFAERNEEEDAEEAPPPTDRR